MIEEEGVQNSRLFQVASQVSETLRMAVLLSELRRRIGSQVRFS